MKQMVWEKKELTEAPETKIKLRTRSRSNELVLHHLGR